MPRVRCPDAGSGRASPESFPWAEVGRGDGEAFLGHQGTAQRPARKNDHVVLETR